MRSRTALTQKLIEAVENADHDKVAFLLKAVPPNAQTESGLTALHADVMRSDDDTAITQLLLKAGADPNLASGADSSPLYTAVCFLKTNKARTMLGHGGNLQLHPADQPTPLEYVSGLLLASQRHIQDLESGRELLLSRGGLSSKKLPKGPPAPAVAALSEDLSLPLVHLAVGNKPKALAKALAQLPPPSRAARATDVLNHADSDTPLQCVAELLLAGADPCVTTTAATDGQPPLHAPVSPLGLQLDRLQLLLKHASDINTRHPDTGDTLLDILERRLVEARSQSAECQAFADLLDEYPAAAPQPSTPAAFPALGDLLNLNLDGIATRRGAFHLNHLFICKAVMLVEGAPRPILDALVAAGLVDSSGPYLVGNPPLIPRRSKVLIQLKGHSWSFFINAGAVPYQTHARDISKATGLRTVLIGRDPDLSSDYAFVFAAGKKVETADIRYSKQKCTSTLRKSKLVPQSTPQAYYDSLLNFLDAMSAPAIIYEPHHGPPIGPFTPATVAESLWLLPHEDCLQP